MQVEVGGNSEAGPWQFTMTNRFRREAAAEFEDALRAVVQILPRR